MPYCAHGSVNRQIGQMPEQEIWKFVLDVSGGLAFLHSQQPPVVHQDIKPDNILVTSDGRYVISDFGISRTFRTKMSRTNNSSSSGTIAYMGPERFSEKPMIVLASDIWAFGMTLYEVMTGDVLWEGMGGCVQLNGARIPAISRRFSPELANLVTSCLAAETWNRPTATQINEYATAMLQHKPVPQLPIQDIKPEPAPAPIPTPIPEPIPEPREMVHKESPVSHSDIAANRRSVINSRINQSKSYTPQTGAGDNSLLKRGLLIAAAVIFGILLITGGTMFISEINEQQDYLSCKTIQDYEQFIKDHPNSSYVMEARQHIASMTGSPAPQPLMEDTHPDTPKPAEHAKNASKPKTIYVTENDEPKQPEPEKVEEPEPAPTPVPAPAPKRPKVSPDDQDFYKCVTARDYDSYLRKYPQGKHRAEAAEALAGLVKQVDHAPKGQVLEEITPGTSGPPPMVDGSDLKVRNTGTSINLHLGGGGGGVGFNRVSSDGPARGSGASHGGGMRSGGSSHGGASSRSGGSRSSGSHSSGSGGGGTRGRLSR
jgi:serine/threonine protein kinase